MFNQFFLLKTSLVLSTCVPARPSFYTTITLYLKFFFLFFIYVLRIAKLDKIVVEYTFKVDRFHLLKDKGGFSDIFCSQPLGG